MAFQSSHKHKKYAFIIGCIVILASLNYHNSNNRHNTVLIEIPRTAIVLLDKKEKDNTASIAAAPLDDDDHHTIVLPVTNRTREQDNNDSNSHIDTKKWDQELKTRIEFGESHDNFQCPEWILSSSNSSNSMMIDERNTKINKKKKKKTRDITMIVILVGQVGNYLSYMARAYAIKRYMEKRYQYDQQKQQQLRQQQQQDQQPHLDNNVFYDDQLRIQLMGQHQSHEQHSRVYEEAKLCFPRMFRNFYQDHGRWDTTGIYKKYTIQQGQWIRNILGQQQRLPEQHTRQTVFSIDTNTSSNTSYSISQQRRIEYHAYSLALDSEQNLCKENITSGMYCWQETYCLLRAMLHQQQNDPNNKEIQEHDGNNSKENILEEDNDENDTNNMTNIYDEELHNVMTNTLSFPFLTVRSLRYIFAIDEFYDEIRYLYRFNQEQCCGGDPVIAHVDTIILDDVTNETNHGTSNVNSRHQRRRSQQQQEDKVLVQKRLPPYDDEVVLHVRSFEKEYKVVGFHEMEPKQVANELFQPYYHNVSIPIALVSKDLDVLDNYEKELRIKGFTTIRKVSGLNGMEDFCFLMKAKYHLIGMKMSTFASWAGILSNATKVRLYAMDSKYTRRNIQLREFLLKHYQFHNQRLQQQIQFETYIDNPF